MTAELCRTNWYYLLDLLSSARCDLRRRSPHQLSHPGNSFDSYSIPSPGNKDFRRNTSARPLEGVCRGTNQGPRLSNPPSQRQQTLFRQNYRMDLVQRSHSERQKKFIIEIKTGYRTTTKARNEEQTKERKEWRHVFYFYFGNERNCDPGLEFSFSLA